MIDFAMQNRHTSGPGSHQPLVGPLPVPYYDDGLITIFCGDSRVIVPQLPKFDLLLTDPPYGINIAKTGKIGKARYEPAEWDAKQPEPWELQMLIASCKESIIWGGNYYEQLRRATCWLVWDKKNDGLSFADAELAWTNLRRAVRMFRWMWHGVKEGGPIKRVHPTQKPVQLMEWCIGKANKPQTVLDPYMGSGSSLIACKQLGIRAVGIDMHEPYCAAAVERLRDSPANA